MTEIGPWSSERSPRRVLTGTRIVSEGLDVKLAGLVLGVVLLVTPALGAMHAEDCYYYHGHHYRYHHHGHYYNHHWAGHYYNYRYRCHGTWCYR
jgi:hypothetical protein